MCWISGLAVAYGVMKLPSSIETDWQRWRDGDERAGRRLFTELQTAVHRFFRCRGRADADDLTQETLMACVRARNRFEGKARLSTYVHTIAIRKLSARSRRPGRPTLDETSEIQGGYRDRPDASNCNIDLSRAMLSLSTQARGVITMYYGEQRRAVEISRVLAVPEATVRSRIRRGLERLRLELADYHSSTSQ